MRGQTLRVQLDIVARSSPDIFRVGQQIVHLIGLARIEVQRVQRQIDHAGLSALRIQVHDHEDDIQKVVGHFAVSDDLFVVHRMKLQAQSLCNAGFSRRILFTVVIRPDRLAGLSKSQLRI